MIKQELLPEVPFRMGPSSLAKELPAIPPDDNRASVHEITFDTAISSQGTLALKDTIVDTITIVSPLTPLSSVDRAIQKTKEDPFRVNISPTSRLIIAAPDVAERIKTALPELPVFGINGTSNLLNEDEIAKLYGIDFNNQGITTGKLQIAAIIIDRSILSRNRGRIADYNHLQTEEVPDKIAPSAIKLATTLGFHEDIIYTQKNYGAHSQNWASETSQISPLAQLLAELDLEVSDNVLVRRALLDRTPLSTGVHGQDLLTLVIAAEYSQATGSVMGKVIDRMSDGLDVQDLLKNKESDYFQLLKIIGEELHAKGKRLIDIETDPDAAGLFRALNRRLAEFPSLGQIIPSIHTLRNKKLINTAAIHRLEKTLDDQHFNGFSDQIRNYKPIHLKQPEAIDAPNILARKLDNAILKEKTSPPVETLETKLDGHKAREGGKTGGGVRLREGQFGEDILTERDIIDTQYQGLFLFNPEKLSLEDNPDLVRAAREFIESEEMPIILPAFNEETGWDVARAANQFSPGRVIMASPSKETLQNAAIHCKAIDENEVKKYINFDKLRELGVLPEGREVPLRGKGMSILAAWLWGMANGYIKKGQYVGHVDTDIISANSDSVAYTRDGLDPKKRLPYRMIEKMAAALALMPPDYRATAIQPAKVGPPRKGEVKHPVFQMFQNSEDPFLRAVGYGLGRVVWPSPGEAIVLSDLYNEGPWQVTTGFDLDRYFKAAIREILKDGKFTEDEIHDVFTQVNIQEDKIENGNVPEINDWTEVNWATSVYYHAIEFYWKLNDALRFKKGLQPLMERLTDEQKAVLPQELVDILNSPDPVLPPQFGMDDSGLDALIAYNKQYAGTKERVMGPQAPESMRLKEGTVHFQDKNLEPLEVGEGAILYPADQIYQAAGGPNTIQYRWNPWYLPSVNWMIENGIIDMEGIRNIKPLEPKVRVRTWRWRDDSNGSS